MGVISALMLVEANNVKQQQKKRCKYCNGTGTSLSGPKKFSLLTSGTISSCAGESYFVF